MPQGREVNYNAFSSWFDRHRAAAKALDDAHALFEEFRGVIGAQPAGPLTLVDCLALGTRQSLLAPATREAAHLLFGRYQATAGTGHLRLHRHRLKCRASLASSYAVVLACLKAPGQFLLCGDSNQIVHPNFFS